MSTGCFFVQPYNYSARYPARYQAGYWISGKTDWPDIRPIQYPVQPYQMQNKVLQYYGIPTEE